MTINTDRRSALKAGAALPPLAHAGLGAGQADHPLRGGVFGQGHSRRHGADARQGRRRRLQARALLQRYAVQAGHRAGRAAARQPGDGQHRTAGHFQAGAGLVDPDLGLSVPGRQPPEQFLCQRPRRADEEDGRGRGQGEDPRTDLLRHTTGRTCVRKENRHTGGHGRHQAPHAARRCLATAGPVARRQPDADGVRRNLHRPPDRRNRWPGQSAPQRPGDEVL